MVSGLGSISTVLAGNLGVRSQSYAELMLVLLSLVSSSNQTGGISILHSLLYSSCSGFRFSWLGPAILFVDREVSSFSEIFWFLIISTVYVAHVVWVVFFSFKVVVALSSSTLQCRLLVFLV